jgi:hypothetical protein
LLSCCFLQLVERLYRSKWTRLDGLGGLVLTPTRELALQIFEELVKVCGPGLFSVLAVLVLHVAFACGVWHDVMQESPPDIGDMFVCEMGHRLRHLAVGGSGDCQCLCASTQICQ